MEQWYGLSVLLVVVAVYVLFTNVILSIVRRILGLRQDKEGSFFAKEPQDYLWGKPLSRDERRAIRNNKGERR